MRYKITTIFLLLAFFAVELQAQDRHFTLYNMSPLTLNPAYSGAFLGTIRVGGIFRDQYPSFAAVEAPVGPTTNPSYVSGNTNVYVTYAAHADAPVLMVRKRDWVGVGLSIYRDVAGTGDLGSSFFMLSGAYHLSLNKKSTSVLTAGVQFGAAQRSINIPSLVFENELDVNNILMTDQNKVNFNDWNGGLLLKSKLNKTSNMELGFAVSHITTPGPSARDSAQYTLINSNAGNRNAELPLLFTAHGKFDMMLNKKLSFSPSFLIQKIRGAKFETVLQAPLGYTLNKEKKQRGHFGLGYRVGDALEVLLGFEQDRLQVWASFDMTLTSDLNKGVGGFGAFELAAGYIINVYKEPEIKPAIICPRL